jgi:hypothetical protein
MMLVVRNYEDSSRKPALGLFRMIVPRTHHLFDGYATSVIFSSSLAAGSGFDTTQFLCVAKVVAPSSNIITMLRGPTAGITYRTKVIRSHHVGKNVATAFNAAGLGPACLGEVK